MSSPVWHQNKVVELSLDLLSFLHMYMSLLNESHGVVALRCHFSILAFRLMLMMVDVVFPLTVKRRGEHPSHVTTSNLKSTNFPDISCAASAFGLSVATLLYNWKKARLDCFYAHMVKHSSHTLVLYTPRILQGFVEYCNRSGKIQQECYVFLVYVNDISQIFVWSLFSSNMTGKTLPSNTVQSDANDAAPVWD